MGTVKITLKDLETGPLKRLYLVVGEEPFQLRALIESLRERVGVDSLETWDGEGLDVGGLLASMNTFPGLFAGEGGQKLVVCTRFEKAQTHALPLLESYFSDPAESTVAVFSTNKADRRKAWVKAIEAHGAVLEVQEPYDRDWPRWQSYFERRAGKRIEPEAWNALVDVGSRTLSLVWAELQKVALYVGKKEPIQYEDVLFVATGGVHADVFGFVEDVVLRRGLESMRKWEELLRAGESEIKLAALVARQFKLVEHFLELKSRQITDSRIVATELGIHPFFVTKISQQAQKHTRPDLHQILTQLADCDYGMKIGETGFFEKFLAPYFACPNR